MTGNLGLAAVMEAPRACELLPSKGLCKIVSSHDLVEDQFANLIIYALIEKNS